MAQLVKIHYPEAPTGTFEVLRHDSTNTAIVYSDDELTTVQASRALNAFGRAKFFTGERVDIRVRDKNGVEIDFWEEGIGEDTVDVRSSSFTGTLANGSLGLGGRISAAAIHDKWKEVNGAADWKIRRSGASLDESIPAAIAALTGLTHIFRVKNYGAKLDGITDDYNAWVLAHAAALAAGGGIIFIDFGTMKTSQSLVISNPRICLMGINPQASQINSPATAGTVIVNTGTATYTGTFITNLGLLNSAATPIGLSTSGNNFTVVDNVISPTTEFVIGTRTLINRCEARQISLNSGAAGSKITNSHIISDSNINGIVISGTADDCQITGNEIDIALGGGGSAIIVANTGTPQRTIIKGNVMKLGAAASLGIDVRADVQVSESNNFMDKTPSNTAPTYSLFAATAVTSVNHMDRGSRIGRKKANFAIVAGAYTPHADYEIHELVMAVASTINAVVGGAGGDGHRMVFLVSNPTGGNLNLTWTGGAQGFNVSASPTSVTAGQRARIEFVFDATNNIYRAVAAAAVFA